MFRRHWKAITFSAVNAFVMVGLALFWLSLPRTFGDEAFFIKWTSLVKKALVGVDEKPAPEDVLYVDVSGSKALIPALDPRYEEYTDYQYHVITDREQLSSFLNYVKDFGEEIPLVILDLTFPKESPEDSLLQAAIDDFPFPLVGAGTLRADRGLLPSAIDLPRGAALYMTTDGSFMKYPMFFGDSLPTLPLVAYKKTDQIPIKNGRLWSWIDRKPCLSNPIVDFKIRPRDLNYGSFDTLRPYNVNPMGSLLFEWEFWEEADLRELLRGKMIIVGDYKNDLHTTVFGTIPGPIVVHNAYLTLLDEDSRISIFWLLFLYALFWWMSYRIYREEQNGERSWLFNRSKTALGRIVADSIDDTLFLVIGTIISYFLFNIHINILVLLIYLKIVAFILRQLFSGRAQKNLSAFFSFFKPKTQSS